MSSKTAESSGRIHPVLETEGQKLRWSHNLEKQGSKQGPDLNFLPSLNVQCVDHLRDAQATFKWNVAKNQSLLHSCIIFHLFSPLPSYPGICRIQYSYDLASLLAAQKGKYGSMVVGLPTPKVEGCELFQQILLGQRARGRVPQNKSPSCLGQ